MKPFKENEPLRHHCTFGIGGPARFFTQVKSTEELKDALHWCREQNLPYFILGKGSNCLFDDRGFNGLVIQNKIDTLKDLGNGAFSVGAGYSFSLLGAQTARKRWAGLEFASGIPGSVGGAVWMNAGANGSETKDVLTAVDVLTAAGEIKTIPRDQIEFRYRFSRFQETGDLITGAHFQLSPSTDARKKQLEIVEYRTSTQPYGEKSAGCLFQNPENSSAGLLIEQCGLKGHTRGGAEVSRKHANFMINRGTGTSEDIKELIDQVRRQVREKTGYDLQTEVRMIPYDG